MSAWLTITAIPEKEGEETLSVKGHDIMIKGTRWRWRWSFSMEQKVTIDAHDDLFSLSECDLEDPGLSDKAKTPPKNQVLSRNSSYLPSFSVCLLLN